MPKLRSLVRDGSDCQGCIELALCPLPLAEAGGKKPSWSAGLVGTVEIGSLVPVVLPSSVGTESLW